MLKRLQFPILIIILLFLLGNIIVLDVYFLNQSKNNTPDQEITSAVPTIEITKSDLSQTPTPSPSPSPTIKLVTKSTVVQSKTGAKDFIISLGSGSGQSSDWMDVPGVGVSLNSDNYDLKEAYFEVSIIMPTSNDVVSLRLYDVTDNHPVWYSQIDSNGLTTAFLSSQAMHLEPGNKFYQVQMKTLLTDQPVNLVESRIHIITK